MPLSELAPSDGRADGRGLESSLIAASVPASPGGSGSRLPLRSMKGRPEGAPFFLSAALGSTASHLQAWPKIGTARGHEVVPHLPKALSSAPEIGAAPGSRGSGPSGRCLSSAPEIGAAPGMIRDGRHVLDLSSAPEIGAAPGTYLVTVSVLYLSSAPEIGAAPGVPA